MYVSVRRYTIRAGSIDALAHRLEEEFAPALSQEHGFLGYLAIRTGGHALETISVFSDADAGHRSDLLAAGYVDTSLREFALERTSVTGGDLLAGRVTPRLLDAAHRWRTQRARERTGEHPAPVLVIGATGRTGQKIVARLREHGVPVHALVRDAERGRSVLGPDVRLYEGDLLDRDTLAAPMAGTQAVIVAAAGGVGRRNTPLLVDYFGTQNVVKQAVAAGVGLVVFVSSIYATRPDFMQDVEPTSLGWKARAEEVVRAGGVPYCIVRAGWLTDDPGGDPLALTQGDTGEGRLAREDLADVCVRVLDIPAARGKTFEVVAARLGEAVGLEEGIAELAPDAEARPAAGATA